MLQRVGGGGSGIVILLLLIHDYTWRPQVDAWRPLQASRLLEGPIGLRRN